MYKRPPSYWREYYLKNTERRKEQLRKSRSKPDVKERRKAYMTEYAQRNREVINANYRKNVFNNKARAKLSYAVRVGKILRQPCEVCGDSKSEAHHEDYSKPLDVIWLCRKHHCEKRRIVSP